MTRRLRLLHILVQPVLVWDDGETLAAGPKADGFTLSMADLDEFPAKFRADLERLREQLPPPADTTT